MARTTVDPNQFDEDEDMITATDEEVAGAMFEDNQDGLVVDLRNVEEMKFELLPDGNYNGIIEDNQYALSKSSGKPMWNLKVNITDEGEYQNRKLFAILSFSEKALPGTKTALLVIDEELANREGGFKVNDPETVASLIGKPVRVKVGRQKSEGYDEQNRIKRWLQPDANAFITA